MTVECKQARWELTRKVGTTENALGRSREHAYIRRYLSIDQEVARSLIFEPFEGATKQRTKNLGILRRSRDLPGTRNISGNFGGIRYHPTPAEVEGNTS